MAEPISDRKRAHLDLCEQAEVEYARKTTLLEEVDLVHDALPELAVAEIDVGASLLGKRLRAPLLITGMTGGTSEAAEINQALARVAEEHGIAFGLGSQRAMQRAPELAYTFAVRAHAPTALVLANLGLVQAVGTPTAEVAKLVERVGADAVCIHLNPAQEMIQPGGDRDFRGGLAAFARLVRELPVPVVAKETGCGIAPAVALRLREVGVRTIDVSGAGGTSWVKVEALRADDGGRVLGDEFADWGIPRPPPWRRCAGSASRSWQAGASAPASTLPRPSRWGRGWQASRCPCSAPTARAACPRRHAFSRASPTGSGRPWCSPAPATWKRWDGRHLC